MTTWLTSDWHLGHRNIIKYCQRPYADVDTMNQDMIARHNGLVAGSDTVWVLGDVVMSSQFLPLVSRFNGRKILVPGNHDAAWRGTDKWRPENVDKYLEAGFAEVIHEPQPLRVGGIDVQLSHFPYLADTHDSPRFVQWRLPDTGGWLFCGHIHTQWRQHQRQINVGSDAWGGSPVQLSDLADLIATGPGELPPLPWTA